MMDAIPVPLGTIVIHVISEFMMTKMLKLLLQYFLLYMFKSSSLTKVPH